MPGFKADMAQALSWCTRPLFIGVTGSRQQGTLEFSKGRACGEAGTEQPWHPFPEARPERGGFPRRVTGKPGHGAQGPPDPGSGIRNSRNELQTLESLGSNRKTALSLEVPRLPGEERPRGRCLRPPYEDGADGGPELGQSFPCSLRCGQGGRRAEHKPQGTGHPSPQPGQTSLLTHMYLSLPTQSVSRVWHRPLIEDPGLTIWGPPLFLAPWTPCYVDWGQSACGAQERNAKVLITPSAPPLPSATTKPRTSGRHHANLGSA